MILEIFAAPAEHSIPGFLCTLMCTSDVGLHYATVWKLPLIAALQDIGNTFDSMPHDLIGKALQFKGVSPLHVGLHLRELTGLQGKIKLPMAGN